MLNSRNETALNTRGCLIIPLEQAMLRGDDGNWNLSQWAHGQLVAFRDRLMPPAKTVTGRFPTPSGSRWSDCQMRFSDTEKISVNIGEQRQVLTYSQLGWLIREAVSPANSGATPKVSLENMA